jgi:hydrogenase maturation protein HypF
MLWECGHDWPSAPDPDGLARAAWQRGINCPETSAAGRLFDGAAALVCEMPVASFEAQGPMVLEALCRKEAEPLGLPLIPGEDGILRSDWQALLKVLPDNGIDPNRRAEIFHASMAGAIRDQAVAARQRGNVAQVGLGGGVFQNRVLAEQATRLLEGEGFDVFLPQALPCNDAALSFGQAAESAAREARE